MEHKVKVLPPEVLMEPLLAMLEDGAEVPLVISGNSMSPFMVHGRDTVYLSKVTEPLKKGDMILYRRDSGDYVLHRICKVVGEEFHLVGDAQYFIEKGVRKDMVLAIVKKVKRKDKIIAKGNICWDFFEKLWINIIPLRRPAVLAYTKLFHRN